MTESPPETSQAVAGPRERRCDVLVVGAGPAGSAAAALFAQAGWHVRLLDRARFPRFKPCGDFLSPEGTRILRRLGVEGAVRRSGARRLRGLLVSAYGEPALRADFEPNPYAFGYALERLRFDALLLDAAGRAGAEVLEGWTVDGLGEGGAAPRESNPVVSARPPEGDTVGLPARLVLGAGGLRCPVARDLGFQRRAAGDGRVDLLCHWTGVDAGRAYCEMHVSPPGYTGVAPSAPNLLNVNTVVPTSWLRARAGARNGRPGLERSHPEPAAGSHTRSAGDQSVNGRADLRSVLYDELVAAAPAVRRAVRGGTRLYDPVATDITPLRTVRASAPGVMLLGDAALFIDPFTGQGIYMALRSAEMAFEVGDGALRAGDLGAARLAAYDRLRAREFDAKVRVSLLLQWLLPRPWAARRVAAALRRDRRGSERLIGVIGDYRPAADLLGPGFLARLASAGLC